MLSVPPVTVVLPAQALLSAVSTSVPVPDLVRLPDPVKPWLEERAKTLFASAMSKLPPFAPQMMLRDVEVKLVPVTCRMPH